MLLKRTQVIFKEKEREEMKKYIISEDYFYAKTRDRIGGTIRTDVHRNKDGLFKAYSCYWQDEDELALGYAEDFDEELAIKLSRKDLRKEWKEYQEQKATGAIEKNSKIVTLAEIMQQQ